MKLREIEGGVEIVVNDDGQVHTAIARGWRIEGMLRAPFAITTRERTYSITHLPTGWGLARSSGWLHPIDAARVAKRIWGALSSEGREFWSRGDVVAHQSAPEYLEIGRLLSRFSGRRATARSVPVRMDAVNRFTGERRTIWVSDDTERDCCSGPCECTIEPDGVCSHGWPAIEEVVIECLA